MKELKPLSRITLQEQLYDEIYDQIKTGVYKEGERIPPEMQLIEMYHISRVTVRKAIQQLVDDQILVKKHGKGTYVKTHVHTEREFTGGSFTDTCLRMNAKPSTKIIECKLCIGEKEILNQLNHDSKTLIEITRLRLVDDIPCIVEVDYFPDNYTFLLENDLSQCSLLKMVQTETVLIPSKFEDHFSISYSNKLYAKLLNTQVGTPLLEVTQSVMNDEGIVIYINKQYILTSKYVYAIRSSSKG